MLKLLDRLAGCWLDWRTDQAVKRFPPELLELNLHKVKAGENGWQVVMSAPAVVVLADQAAALLNAEHAENYVQFDMMPRLDRGKPPIRITVQWASGDAPGPTAARRESELAGVRGDTAGRCPPRLPRSPASPLPPPLASRSPPWPG